MPQLEDVLGLGIPSCTLPNEVFDLIFFHVDRPVDLLSCSLACKSLHRIVSSEHLQYCRIQSDLARIGLWKHLAANPRLAARVRDLYIQYEGQDSSGHPVVPRCMLDEALVRFGGNNEDPEIYDDAVQGVAKELILAIRCMPNLRRFDWRLRRILPTVFHAIGESCVNLDTLIFTDSGHDHMGEKIDHVELLSPFRSLKRFSYTNPPSSRGWRVPSMRNGRLRAFRELLHERCPDLEDLHLTYAIQYSHDLPGIFMGAHWANLKRLSTSAEVLQEHYEEFFTLHPALDVLQIHELNTEEHQFNGLALRSLHSLDIDWTIYSHDAGTTLGFGSAAPNVTNLSINLFRSRVPPIYRWRDPNVDCSLRRVHHDLNFLTTFTSLQQLVIRSRLRFPDLIQTLLRTISPTIEKLAYQALDEPIEFADVEPASPYNSANISEIAQLLRRLPNLTHLGFIHLPPATSQDVKNVETALVSSMRTLSDAAPKLEFVGCHPDPASLTSELWMMVERTSDGKFSSCAQVSDVDHREDIDIDVWGGYRCGVLPTTVQNGEPRGYWGWF